MRKSYDLDSLPHPVATLPADPAPLRYMEVARSGEPSGVKTVNGPAVSTLLIEPNSLLREGLKRILAETPYALAVSAASLEEARSVLPSDCTLSLLILDAARDHDEVCRQIQLLKSQQASARVVMLVDQYDLRQVLAAFQSGADACLMKSVSCEVLVKTLDLVMLGETVFPSAVLKLLQEQGAPVSEAEADQGGIEHDDGDNLPAKGLSGRETVILRCLMEGDSNKIIARKFDITEATVKVHVKAILRKIRAKNRTQAAIWAASHLPAGSRATAS